MKLEKTDWATTKKIVCCSVCNGTGIRECEELTSYHKGEYDYWNELCYHCGGEGRVLEVKYYSRVDLILPNGKTDCQSIERKDVEKLDGRKTSDIYQIGVRR